MSLEFLFLKTKRFLLLVLTAETIRLVGQKNHQNPYIETLRIGTLYLIRRQSQVYNSLRPASQGAISY